MANSCLYLHETIDIVGAGSEAYKAHTGALGTNRTDGGAPLVGTWQQSGSTGSWPTVVNLWEMRGWDHWAEILARQYTRASGQEKKLGRWWKEATKFRSGGFDRILEPAPFCPTRAEIVERGVRGLACLQEVATVKPGTAERYLDALASRWLDAAAKRGLTLLGAWRTAMRDTEAVVLWSLPSFADFTRHLATLGGDRASRAWLERAREWRVDYRETLLVPSVWCVTHPDWRESPPRRRRRPELNEVMARTRPLAKKSSDATREVLDDPDLMRQLRESERFYATGKRGLSFEDVFRDPLETGKRRRSRPRRA